MRGLFSREIVEQASASMARGEKPLYRISDTFSDEDIENAWRVAYQRSFPLAVQGGAFP